MGHIAWKDNDMISFETWMWKSLGLFTLCLTPDYLCSKKMWLKNKQSFQCLRGKISNGDRKVVNWSEEEVVLFLPLFSPKSLFRKYYTKKKKKKLSQLKILRQPASADFWVVSTCCFKFIQQKVENLLQKKVERTQKSAEAGCLKILSCLYFFFYKCRWYRSVTDQSMTPQMCK